MEEDKYESKLKESVFFVESTGFEHLSLYREFTQNYGLPDWKQDGQGFWQIIGYIDENKEKPVKLSFRFAHIFNKRVCFYHVSSRYSDKSMVEEWLLKHYPVKCDEGTRSAMSDSMNFHNVIKYCKE